MKCSSCGKDIDKTRSPSDITFCPYCGDELHDEHEENAMQFCPYCGEKLIIQASFCPHCGNKLLPGGRSTASKRIEAKTFIEQAAKPIVDSIKDNLGPERKMKKLYKQWVAYSNLPPEQIPSIDKDIEERNRPKEKEISGNDYRDYIQ
jgi:DNA-directed RNA polymerase subunit RPC12/RpoP